MPAAVQVQRRMGQQPMHDTGIDDRNDGVVGASDDESRLPDEGRANRLVHTDPASS